MKFFVKTLRLCTLYLLTSLISRIFQKKFNISKGEKSRQTLFTFYILRWCWSYFSLTNYFIRQIFHIPFWRKSLIFSKLNVNNIFTFRIDEKKSKFSVKNVNKSFTFQFDEKFRFFFMVNVNNFLTLRFDGKIWNFLSKCKQIFDR